MRNTTRLAILTAAILLLHAAPLHGQRAARASVTASATVVDPLGMEVGAGATARRMDGGRYELTASVRTLRSANAIVEIIHDGASDLCGAAREPAPREPSRIDLECRIPGAARAPRGGARPPVTVRIAGHV